MDYEKKYKEAINRAKAMIKVANNQEETYNSVITIFPELKESEDERIRKALVRFHKSSIDIDGIKGEDILAWLEKQGEFDANIITRDDEILQALSIGLSDVTEKLRWSDFGGLPVEEIQNWLEKQGERKPVNDTDEDIVEAVTDTSILDMVEPKFKKV